MPWICAIMTLQPFLSFAQNDSADAKVFKAYPLAYYTPETRIAFELFAFYSFYAEEAERKSNFRFFATYTQNNQYLFILPWQVYTRNEKQFHNGRLDYRFFPEYYYGIGNNTREENRELYDFNALTLQSKNLFKIDHQTYFGISSHFQSLGTAISPDLELFDDVTDMKGRNGYNYFAAGPSFMWDQRDHILCPTRGSFLDFNLLLGQGMAGNHELKFAMLQFDYRKYHQLRPGITWANQFVAQITMGELPFRALPTLGGPYLHRGYYQGRFRDKHMMLYQTEYRQHVVGRIGFVAFASAGRVYNRLDKQIAQKIHPGGGVGLRFKISKNDQTNIRLDYSVTPDSKGLYIYFAEAF
ncbi:MAG: BamA/TamA family outer membrane protein [Cyclobacteriaceae bacterium]|nr:BamA/TamA family outer membrane protein [Cyclobacteriaceae bacterium]